MSAFRLCTRFVVATVVLILGALGASLGCRSGNAEVPHPLADERTPTPKPTAEPSDVEQTPVPSGEQPVADANDTSAAECGKDQDCAPASCCHPSSCVARSLSPDCRAVMCTLECRPKTLDCGGGCACLGGRCAAKLGDPGK